MNKPFALLLLALVGFSTGIAQTSGYQGKRIMVAAGTSLSGSFLFNGGIAKSRFFPVDIQAGYIVSRSATLSLSVRSVSDRFAGYIRRYTYPGYTGSVLYTATNNFPYLEYIDTCKVRHTLLTAEFRRFLGLGRGDFAPWGPYVSIAAGACLLQIKGDSAYTNEILKPMVAPLFTVGLGSQMLLLKRATLDYGIQSGLPLVTFNRLSSYSYVSLDGQPSDVVNRYALGNPALTNLAQHLSIAAYVRMGILL